MGQYAWYDDPRAQAYCVSLAGTLSLGLQCISWRRLRGTTLTAPLCWGGVAVGALVVAAWRNDPYVEYAAAVLLIAPTLAMLGAKRPQNGAWQFIVLTLVGVLLLPALQGWAYGDSRPHVHALFRWLIAAHIFLGCGNYLPTRYGGPALAFAAAQTCLASRFLPGVDADAYSWRHASPAFASSFGVIVSLGWATARSTRASLQPPGLDRLWRDFRDAYGLVWGLRIAERLNASAVKHGWPAEFAWGGLIVKTENGTLDAAVRHRVERELRSHLRRFVSHDWIVRRMEPVNAAAARPLTRGTGTE